MGGTVRVALLLIAALATVVNAQQSILTEAEAVQRARRIAEAIAKRPVGDPDRIERYSSRDELGQTFYTGWGIVFGDYVVSFNDYRSVIYYSLLDFRPYKPGNDISEAALRQEALRSIHALVDGVPAGWVLVSPRNLDASPGLTHIREAKGIREFRWANARNIETDATITVRIRRDTGAVQSWVGFVPRHYGPSTPGISAASAKARAIDVISGLQARFPAERDELQLLKVQVQSSTPKLVWSRASRNCWDLRECATYWKRQELRLAYLWDGNGTFEIDANSGVPFSAFWDGPPKSAPSARTRSPKRQPPLVPPRASQGATAGRRVGARMGRSLPRTAELKNSEGV